MDFNMALWIREWRYGSETGSAILPGKTTTGVMDLKMALWFWQWRYGFDTGDMSLKMAL